MCVFVVVVVTKCQTFWSLAADPKTKCLCCDLIVRKLSSQAPSTMTTNWADTNTKKMSDRQTDTHTHIHSYTKSERASGWHGLLCLTYNNVTDWQCCSSVSSCFLALSLFFLLLMAAIFSMTRATAAAGDLLFVVSINVMASFGYSFGVGGVEGRLSFSAVCIFMVGMNITISVFPSLPLPPFLRWQAMPW